MKILHVTHESVEPFIYRDSEILILGSFPSVKSRKDGFYYAFKTNRFFKVISSLFKENEPLTISEKKDFLKRHKIALYDVIFECDISGSSDSSIKNIVPTDIKEMIKETNIKKIYTTGKKAYELYHKNIGYDNIPLPSTSALNASYDLDELIEAYKIILK